VFCAPTSIENFTATEYLVMDSTEIVTPWEQRFEDVPVPALKFWDIIGSQKLTVYSLQWTFGWWLEFETMRGKN